MAVRRDAEFPDPVAASPPSTCLPPARGRSTAAHRVHFVLATRGRRGVPSGHLETQVEKTPLSYLGFHPRRPKTYVTIKQTNRGAPVFLSPREPGVRQAWEFRGFGG